MLLLPPFQPHVRRLHSTPPEVYRGGLLRAELAPQSRRRMHGTTCHPHRTTPSREPHCRHPSPGLNSSGIEFLEEGVMSRSWTWVTFFSLSRTSALSRTRYLTRDLGSCLILGLLTRT